MKQRIIRGVFVATLVGLLAGCYLPMPNDKDVDTTTYSLLTFRIVSQSATDFQWDIDGYIEDGETEDHFEYITLPQDIGDHTVTACFKDGLFLLSHTWNVYVKPQNPSLTE